jgi:DNA recombination-dependent growth factor C
MGALRGSIAVRRYAVLEPLPAEPRRRLVKGLRAHAFMPLDPKSDESRASGWVSILDGDDADLQPEKVFFVAPGGEQLRVALRTDVLKPPASEVRRQVNARAQEMEAAEGRPLSRREKRLLKEEVSRTLRLRAFPRVKVIDVVWDLDGKRVYFWSQTKAANEAFVDAFVKSFGLKLEVEGAARWAHAAADAKALARLEPTRELWFGFPGVRPLASGEGGEEAA